jgi:putative membrane protein
MTVQMPGAGEFAVVGIVALLWAIVSIAFGIGLIVLVVLGIRWLLRNTATGSQLTGPARRGPADDAAMAALRERYARGEIDAEEFEQRRRVLGG